MLVDANGLQNYISFKLQIPSSGDVIRNQMELNRIPSNMEDVWIAQFPISKQKGLELSKQQSMKNLTIGINALNGISVLELSGLEALERVKIMRGGLSGGSGKWLVTNCSSLISIDIGEFAFVKYKDLELVSLPLLQAIDIGNNGFQNVYSTLMESNLGSEMMTETCLHYSPFNWETMHFREIAVTNVR
jgi:hypothetical protein